MKKLYLIILIFLFCSIVSAEPITVTHKLLTNTAEPGKIVIFEFTEAGIEKIRESYPGHPDATNPIDYIGDLNLEFIIKKGGLINAYIFHKK